MPTGWVAAPAEAVLDQVAAALDRSGAVLVGADGVGKTLTARAAAERFTARRPSTVRWVRGTPSLRMVPFGAFGRLLDVAEIGRPAALLRAAHDSLVAGGDLLVVVDDAHELDSLSAGLVYQLALKRSARLIVTVRAETALPDAVAALWTDDLLTRIDVERPDRAAPQPDEYLSGLAAPVRKALDYLAVAEPLHRSDLAALAGDEAVEQGEAAGAVSVSDEGVVYAGHPLYTERVRAALAPADARSLRTAVVGQLSTRRFDHVTDRLRLAALAIDSDAAYDDFSDAAQQALRLGELGLAERLARAALGKAGGLAPRLTLGYALGWQGRGREAGEVLAAVDPDTLTDTELMAWALPRAANQFWMLDEPERATAFLHTTRNRVSSPMARATLDALAATFAMNAGTPLSALRIAGEVLASPHATRSAWAGLRRRRRCARRGSGGSTTSSRWRAGRWRASIRVCCGSPAVSRG